ncbi:MAG TPA: cytochrome b [Aestuariivirga sp.]|nr:cytochrome b [Aestuariivirga sp.]
MSHPARLRYNTVAIILHWLIAALMIFMLVKGEDMMQSAELGDNGPVAVHVSLGVLILVLSLLRLLWRVMNPPPPLEAESKAWEVTLSKVTHILFYVLMIGLPISGALGFAGFSSRDMDGATVNVLGLFPMPLIPNPGLPAIAMHKLGANLAIALTVLHVLAALKHQFIDRDGVLSRMSPH